MELFRTVEGVKVSELRHTIETLKRHPGARVYVGTDSQNKKRHTNYVVVIAYRYGHKGAHIIYKKTKVKKIRDRWTRLWKEVEMSLLAANRLKDVGVDIYSIDLDYNKNEFYIDSKGKEKKTGSHNLVSAATGACIGQGYRVSVKPDEQVACKAADHLVR